MKVRFEKVLEGSAVSAAPPEMVRRKGEQGIALVAAIIILVMLGVIAATALSYSATEARIANSELVRTQTFYATSAGLEKMTNDFSNLFKKKFKPTAADLVAIASAHPSQIVADGFSFDQVIEEDNQMLSKLRTMQGIPNTAYPRVNIPEGPYAGLFASIVPYKMRSEATHRISDTKIKLEREFNNYLVPIFQFGMFSNEDLEFMPGPFMTFNGRIHSNANIYALRNVKFQSKVTAAGELIRSTRRSGQPNNQTGWDNVWITSGGVDVQIGPGSMAATGGTSGGPLITGALTTERGYFPGSPVGEPNPNWETRSILPALGGNSEQFGGQILTRTTGAAFLKMPLETEGNSAAEIVKRTLPADSDILKGSRYHNKAQIRILLDHRSAPTGAANVSGIPAGRGVQLDDFIPSELGGGTTLRQFSDAGVMGTDIIKQRNPDSTIVPATTVRKIKNGGSDFAPSGSYIPRGSGIRGRIYIEVIAPDGTAHDVTQAVLSMGVTEGEPNGIVYLQRPLWAAYVQGNRDRAGNNLTLASLTSTPHAADGEIIDPTAHFDAGRGFINTGANLNEDNAAGEIIREDNGINYNQIVPINVYNVREGWFKNSLDIHEIYERGMTSVVEINMKNLARWLDGKYDANLLAGTNAVSANINGEDGYVVYVSDRRGDRVKSELYPDGTAYVSANGIVDNEDVYGPNNTLDVGEDVINFGYDVALGAPKKSSLQKDTVELPDSGTIGSSSDPRRDRSNEAMEWNNENVFRRSLRLFNGETLSFTAATGKLSPTKGITMASENMIYVWGNYNTTGITGIPAGGSTLNEGGYTGPQIPASIVGDAIFPLSKTWFDGLSSLYPEGNSDGVSMSSGTAYREADANLSDVTQSTSVRAAMISGNTLSALSANPGRTAGGQKLSGGAINFPRFLEVWNWSGFSRPWNYTGSFVPLFPSTQAMGPWENDTPVIYMPPRRNWSFDTTYRSPQKLPPGTPFFQYVQSTGFRQKMY
jgi:hypothetical protein